MEEGILESPVYATATSLLDDWESALLSFKNEKNNGNRLLLPTSIQLYRLGLVLYTVEQSPTSTASKQTSDLRRAFDRYFRLLPVEHCQRIFRDLNQALSSLLDLAFTEPSSLHMDNLLTALQSLTGLYKASDKVTKTASSWSLDRTKKLASLYHNNRDAKIDKRNNETEMRQLIISNLSHTFWTNGDSIVDWEQLLPAIHFLQNEEGSGDLWNALLLCWGKQNHNWRQDILACYPDPTHQEYLSSLLHENKEETSSTILSIEKETVSPISAPPAAVAPLDEIQRRIDLVRQVLPHLGEGFVESALSCCQGDVERTMAILLDEQNQWPASLRILDQKLPRRGALVNKKKQEAENKEARLVTKLALQAAARREEEEAQRINRVMAEDEYNDDYDDQYDEMDDMIGGTTDSGLYDNYDDVRTYNRVLRGVQDEQKFWEENRNLNHRSKDNSSNKTNGSNDGGMKAYRGPDKLKGGRLPKPDAERRRGGTNKKILTEGENNFGTEATSEKKKDKANNKKQNTEQGQKPNPRQKARKMANRRDRQKQANAKRAGG